MIQIWPVGECSLPADISEWLLHRSWCSPTPSACAPTTTPLVKITATTAKAPATIATDAAIRFSRFFGQRRPARDSAVVGAVPVISTVGALVAAVIGSVVGSPVAVRVGSVVGSLVAVGVASVVSVVSFDLGSGVGLLGRPGVSVIPLTLPTDVMRRMGRSEEDAVNGASRIYAHPHGLLGKEKIYLLMAPG
jgi:hypothetical protein